MYFQIVNTVIVEKKHFPHGNIIIYDVAMLEVFFLKLLQYSKFKNILTRAEINIGLVEAFAPGQHISFDV